MAAALAGHSVGPGQGRSSGKVVQVANCARKPNQVENGVLDLVCTLLTQLSRGGYVIMQGLRFLFTRSSLSSLSCVPMGLLFSVTPRCQMG